MAEAVQAEVEAVQAEVEATQAGVKAVQADLEAVRVEVEAVHAEADLPRGETRTCGSIKRSALLPYPPPPVHPAVAAEAVHSLAATEAVQYPAAEEEAVQPLAAVRVDSAQQWLMSGLAVADRALSAAEAEAATAIPAQIGAPKPTAIGASAAAEGTVAPGQLLLAEAGGGGAVVWWAVAAVAAAAAGFPS